MEEAQSGQSKADFIHKMSIAQKEAREMETIIVNQPQLDLAKVVAEINEKHQPILIQGTTGNAILVSEQEWNEIQETLYLQSIPGMVESIHQAAATPIEDCIDVKDIDW